ncbi:hypothetical protein Pyn_08834 [Prunus yedoensis var. nudiflora]|uniref:Tetrapyrrole biosynthesis glutamyl-tRNA reductase dimerisation domain-containing protein n=1 Tax=Prunus yedoensis var. nudiflora TaxID=2094558 RepID=A0A314ZBY4_PRUYE|nr:hypothetical protein Pyn_08834 [Prunus yedoensis var. nudiflora]
MIVLPLPCAAGPREDLHHSLVCKASSISTRRRNNLCRVSVTSTYQPKSLFQILINNNPLQHDNRLEAIGEKVIELEKKKFMNKTKGSELSHEESILVEDLSRDIVNKFLGKPIEYLRSGDGDLREKLKELEFLVDILEESCLMGEKVPNIISCKATLYS